MAVFCCQLTYITDIIIITLCAFVMDAFYWLCAALAARDTLVDCLGGYGGGGGGRWGYFGWRAG